MHACMHAYIHTYIYVCIHVCTKRCGHRPYDPPTFVLIVNFQYLLLFFTISESVWILHILIWAHLSRIFVSSKASDNPMIQPKHRPAAPTKKEAQRPKTKKTMLGGERLVSLLCWCSLVFPMFLLVFFGENQKPCVFLVSASWEAATKNTVLLVF